MARSARGGRPSCSAMISRSASVTGSNRCSVLLTRSRLMRGPSAARDLVPQLVVPGTVLDLLLTRLRRLVRHLVLGQLHDVRRLARLHIAKTPSRLSLDLRGIAQLALAVLELSDLRLQQGLLGLLLLDLGPLGEVGTQ